MNTLPPGIKAQLDGIPQRLIEGYLDERKGHNAIRHTVCLADLCHKQADGNREIHPKKCLGCNDLVVQN